MRKKSLRKWQLIKSNLAKSNLSPYLHNEIEVNWILEAVVHLHHPLVVGLHENITLRPDVGHLLLLQHVRLAEDLHRVDVPGVVLLHQTNCKGEKGGKIRSISVSVKYFLNSSFQLTFTKGAPPNDLQRHEVLDAEARSLEAEKLRLLGRVLTALLLFLRMDDFGFCWEKRRRRRRRKKLVSKTKQIKPTTAKQTNKESSPAPLSAPHHASSPPVARVC